VDAETGAEIGLRDRKRHRRPKEEKDTGENPQQKRPILTTPQEMCGLVGLDEPNCQPPTQSSNRSLTSESGTEIFDAETGGRIGLIRGKCETRDCAY
jgi:hypothetical protein